MGKKKKGRKKKKKKKINRFEKNLGSITIFILTHGGTESGPRKKVKRLGLKPATIWPNGME